MEGKHTPGPWDCETRDDPFYFPIVLIGPPGEKGRRARIHINEGPSPEMVAKGESRGTTEETANANARLIAASPDLLAALEAVEWILVPGGWGSAEFECPWCERCKASGHAPDCPRQAAIAKAAGSDG